MGQTTVRKGRGNSTVSKSIFCGGRGGGVSTYKIILGIHTYIFHNRECDFFLKYFFKYFWGQPSDGGGTCPLRPPRDLRPWSEVHCLYFILTFFIIFIISIENKCLSDAI